MNQDEGLDRDIGIRLTLLTLLILALIGLLIVETGLQAMTSERRFFRDLTFDANSAVAHMVAREFTQVFANAAGLVEDVAAFPTVGGHDEKSTKLILDLVLHRHPTLRSLAKIGVDGKIEMVSFSRTATTTEFARLPQPEFERMKAGKPHYLSREPYFEMPERKAESPLAVLYAVRIEEQRKKAEDVPAFAGVLVAEIDLEFIPDILAAVQVGHTGQFLIASKGEDGKGRIIYSSRNLRTQDMAQFISDFPIDAAYRDERVGFEYGSIDEPHMASFARIHTVALEPGHRYFGRNPFPVAISPARIPDWVVVVQQQAREGYLIADRMKWNIAVLVIVGLAGLSLIGKLWFDSLTS